ncbi:Nudix family hydrolase [Thioalkalivibrio sp. HK1]|uniref:Nudix family hydrolase n=1 Tax=Thioalkalivibrio sp. HK1 TaxID=1469245 RepID=UPI000470D2F9|nr:Nudix family hydrolase [Thioalkalivibrio sp. HK1]
MSRDLSPRSIHVVAGVVLDPKGRNVLVARRVHGRFSGRREFPGGKVEPGESRWECLARELAEEVGIRIEKARPLIRLRHRYLEREIDLDIWRVESFSGEAKGCEGQPIEWLPLEDLDPSSFLPANERVITALRLPARYLITPEPRGDARAFLDRLAQRVDRGFDLVQLRAKTIENEDDLLRLARSARAICEDAGARLLVNASPALALRSGADGVHLDSKRLFDLADGPARSCAADIEALDELRDKGALIAASCHDEREIDLSKTLRCDFAVAGPVHRTATHPEASILGWQGFTALVRRACMPIFALGGLEEKDIPLAHGYGAQGVAAIRAFWEG